MAKQSAYYTHLISKAFGCYLVCVGQLTGSVYCSLIVQLIKAVVWAGVNNPLDYACIFHQWGYHSTDLTIWLGKSHIISLSQPSDSKKSDNFLLYFWKSPFLTFWTHKHINFTILLWTAVPLLHSRKDWYYFFVGCFRLFLKISKNLLQVPSFSCHLSHKLRYRSTNFNWSRCYKAISQQTGCAVQCLKSFSATIWKSQECHCIAKILVEG